MTNLVESGAIERPKILINGSPITVELLDDLIDLRVETTVCRPAQATLRFYDDDFEVIDAATMTVGTPINVAFEATGERGAPTSVFDGEITSVGIEAGLGGSPIAVITARDLAHRLGRSSRQRVFANQTYTDMIRKIAAENGLQVDVVSLSTTFEHITQNVDDEAFINEICRRTGLIWIIQGKKLIVKPATLGTADTTLTRGTSLLRLRAQFDGADDTDEVTVRGWDPKTKRELVSRSSSRPESLSGTSLASGSRSAVTRSFRATRVTGANVTASADEASTLATSLHHRAVSDEIRVRGEAVGRPNLVAGCTVKLEKVGTKLSGTYFVTSAEHVYSPRNYVTRFVCGGAQPTTLADLVGGGSVSPHALGAVIGVVSNVGKDDFAGQVKVKLPTIGDNLESTWARVVTPGGGASRGLQLMPSVNDEVLVVFEHGDLRRPFVLGGLWNPTDKLPLSAYQTGSDVTEWILKDRVGHALSFRSGSEENKRNVELLLADGKTKLFVGQDKVELWAAQGKPLQLKSGDGSITITANGEIEIKGAKITITGTNEIALKATSVKLNSDASMSLQAQATLELKSSASAKLDGGGMTEIKGGMVKVN